MRTTPKPAAVLTCAALLSCLLSSTLAAQSALQKLVDTTDPIPGAPDAFWHESVPFEDVAIDGEEVVFIANSKLAGNISRSGIYRLRGGPLELVVDTDTPLPRSDRTFGSFNTLSLDDGLLAFSAGLVSPYSGVYTVDGTRVRVVADQRTRIPGQEGFQFGYFGDVAVHQGTVIFGAGIDRFGIAHHQRGLYVGGNGVIARLVDDTTPIPGGGGTFDLVNRVGLDDRGYAFTRPRLNVSVDEGIYRNLGDRITKVADLSTVAPHTGELFERFVSLSYDRGSVLFFGRSDGESGLYLYDGQLRTVASPDTLYPGAGVSFVGFIGGIALSEGRVVFGGYTSTGRQGLFLVDGLRTITVVERGDQLDGRVVKSFGVRPEGFDWPNLVVEIELEDDVSALYRFNAVADDTLPPDGPWLTSSALPGFRVKARISAGGTEILGEGVASCIADTLCVSGAVPDRPELFVRVVGPKPNGKLWPTVVKFSTSRIEVWIEQTDRGVVRYYDLPPVAAGEVRLDLDGLADRYGFDP